MIRRLVDRRSRERAAPDPLTAGEIEWTDSVLAALLLFRVPPTDRALAGWDPGFWHLPHEPGPT